MEAVAGRIVDFEKPETEVVEEEVEDSLRRMAQRRTRDDGL